MKWEDEGVLLSSRPFGENSAIIEVLTLQHGRHLGMVRQAYSKKKSNLLEPGAQLKLIWGARLHEHLGVFSIEEIRSRTSQLIVNKDVLLGFNAIVSLLIFSLPEREPFENVYNKTIELIDSMEVNSNWISGYVRWELFILAELGYGLDLSTCAVTGSNLNLIYVSPKTGRAVCQEVGREWRKKLIPLPNFLASFNSDKESDRQKLLEGLTLTGYVLKKWLFSSLDRQSLPEARDRFVSSISC